MEKINSIKNVTNKKSTIKFWLDKFNKKSPLLSKYGIISCSLPEITNIINITSPSNITNIGLIISGINIQIQICFNINFNVTSCNLTNKTNSITYKTFTIISKTTNTCTLEINDISNLLPDFYYLTIPNNPNNIVSQYILSYSIRDCRMTIKSTINEIIENWESINSLNAIIFGVNNNPNINFVFNTVCSNVSFLPNFTTNLKIYLSNNTQVYEVPIQTSSLINTSGFFYPMITLNFSNIVFGKYTLLLNPQYGNNLIYNRKILFLLTNTSTQTNFGWKSQTFSVGGYWSGGSTRQLNGTNYKANFPLWGNNGSVFYLYGPICKYNNISLDYIDNIPTNSIVTLKFTNLLNNTNSRIGILLTYGDFGINDSSSIPGTNYFTSTPLNYNVPFLFFDSQGIIVSNGDGGSSVVSAVALAGNNNKACFTWLYSTNWTGPYNMHIIFLEDGICFSESRPNNTTEINSIYFPNNNPIAYHVLYKYGFKYGSNLISNNPYNRIYICGGVLSTFSNAITNIDVNITNF